METIDLESWEEFEERIERLSHWHSERKRGTPSRVAGTYVSDYLFRGQANSNWGLVTTLERFTGRVLTLAEYYQIVWAAKSQVEKHSSTRWDIPSPLEYAADLNALGAFSVGAFTGYEYFSYLRSRGFPSPLLTWTLSPYVAAYFAFRDVSTPESADASIYAYCEWHGSDKACAGARAQIYGLGPDVRSRYQHFQQQNHYTVCLAGQGTSRSYAPHDDVPTRVQHEYDELWKFNIPQSEKKKVLERLEQLDVNALSLYQSEESLMETICLREIVLRGRVTRLEARAELSTATM